MNFKSLAEGEDIHWAGGVTEAETMTGGPADKQRLQSVRLYLGGKASQGAQTLGQRANRLVKGQRHTVLDRWLSLGLSGGKQPGAGESLQDGVEFQPAEAARQRSVDQRW